MVAAGVFSAPGLALMNAVVVPEITSVVFEYLNASKLDLSLTQHLAMTGRAISVNEFNFKVL